MCNHLIGELLDEGSYGKIKECMDLNSLVRRAVKIINLGMVARKIPRGVENVRDEISNMRHLNHKNVIRIYGTFETMQSTYCKDSRFDMNKLLVTPSTMANIQQVG